METQYVKVAFSLKNIVISEAHMVQLPSKSDTIFLTDLEDGETKIYSIIGLMWNIGLKDESGFYANGVDYDVIISVEPIGGKE